MNIYKIWVGPNPMPEVYQQYIDTWDIIQGGNIVEIGNEHIDKVEDSAAVQWGIKNNNWAIVNHYIRYHLMYYFGGIYMDLDVQVVRDSMIWRSIYLEIGMELPNWANNHIMICNKKGHSFFMDCMTVMDCLPYDQMKEVELNTGPRLVTRVLQIHGFEPKQIDKPVSTYHNTTIHPERVFSPHRWNQKFHPSEIKEDTLAVHHFVKSW